MANTPQSIRYIDLGDGQQHPIDAVTFGGKEASAFQESNLVTEINASSDDQHYPSAKCMWDVVGEVESLLSSI
jgi:hypothetical protein